MRSSVTMLLAFVLLLGDIASITAAESPLAPRDTPKGELHNVIARVGYGYKDPYILAELEPASSQYQKGMWLPN